jgi:hypothetical protein
MRHSSQSIWSQPDDALKRLIERVNDEACAEDDETRLVGDLLVRLAADDGHCARIRPASFLRFGGNSFWIDDRSGRALDHVRAWRWK